MNTKRFCGLLAVALVIPSIVTLNVWGQAPPEEDLTWKIESPADGASISNSGNVGVDGTAPDSGLNWDLKIKDSGGYENSCGGSTNSQKRWNGSVSRPTAGNWHVGNADATLTSDGEEQDKTLFDFVAG